MSAEKPPTNLYTALLAAMRAMGPVLKNATNPHLKSKYADLGAVLDTIEEPLWANGLLVVQRFTHDQGGAILVTELIHAASGERLASEVPVVSKDPTDPQKIGAAITYYRRYSLLALLGLAPEDDDGHAASQPPAHRANPAPSFTRPRETPAAPPNLPAVVAAMADQDFYNTPEGAMHQLERATTREEAEIYRKRCKNLGIDPREFGPVYTATMQRLGPASIAG